MKELYILSNKLGFKPQNLSISWKTDSYLWMCEIQKWLREKYKFHIEIEDFYDIKSEKLVYFTTLRTKHAEYYHKDNKQFSSYEEALEFSLTTLLKQIKSIN